VEAAFPGRAGCDPRQLGGHRGALRTDRLKKRDSTEQYDVLHGMVLRLSIQNRDDTIPMKYQRLHTFTAHARVCWSLLRRTLTQHPLPLLQVWCHPKKRRTLRKTCGQPTGPPDENTDPFTHFGMCYPRCCICTCPTVWKCLISLRTSVYRMCRCRQILKETRTVKEAQRLKRCIGREHGCEQFSFVSS
jgi:hypothetical protein